MKGETRLALDCFAYFHVPAHLAQSFHFLKRPLFPLLFPADCILVQYSGLLLIKSEHYEEAQLKLPSRSTWVHTGS